MQDNAKTAEKKKEDKPTKLAISPDMVVWAYRIFLEREPESEEVIRDKAKRLASIDELRGEFINSIEFKAKNPGYRSPILAGNEPAMEIEDVTSDEGLDRIFAHIQNSWQQLGETEPFFSVLSAERFRRDKIGDVGEFYETGRGEVRQILGMLARNQIDPASLKTCLEYGCGLGRVTRWLAESFGKVHGFDISRAHLASASAHLRESGIENVEFHHVKSRSDIIDLPRVDFVYSRIVLQHNPPPLIKLIIREMLAALNPDGVALFQVPTYRIDYSFSLDRYLNSEAVAGGIEMHLLPQRDIFKLIEEADAEPLEVLEDGSTGFRFKEVSNTFIVRKCTV